MRAMILAAGRGERLRPLTDTLPKPLFDIGVINLAHLGDLIRDTLGDGSNWDLNIHYSQEPEGALDTGGAIQQALPLLGEAPFAIINGDIFTEYPLSRLRAIKCDHAHLILVNNPEHNPNGDFALQTGRIDPDGQPRFTFSGISVYNPRFFEATSAGRFSVVPMLIKAAALKYVTGEIYRGAWHDVGTLERLEHLRDEFKDS